MAESGNKSILEQNSYPGSGINNPDLTKSGKNKKLAITSGGQARELARRLKLDDLRSRDARRALIMGAFNGNAPYSAKQLEEMGLDWNFNVSFNHMAGVMGRAIVPYIDFGSDIRYLANFYGDLDDWKLDRTRVEFVKTLKKWGGWMKFYTRLCQGLNLEGWAVAAHIDTTNPWPEFYPQSRCFVPDQSPNDPSNVDLLVLERNYLMHELYDFIREPKTAEKAGWNVENVRASIMRARPKALNSYRSWEMMEKAIRSGYLYWSYQTAKVITVFHVFVTEVEGGVSHWAVEDSNVKGDSYGAIIDANQFEKAIQKNNKDGELFRMEKQFEDMSDVVTYFDVEPGDGCWHGSRGVGQRSYNTHVQIDKLRNQILNTVFTSTLIPLMVPDEIRGQQLDMFVSAPICQFPPGVEMMAGKFPPLDEEMFQADSLLTQSSEQSIGDVVPQGKDATTGDKTATQSNIDASRSAAIQRSGLKRFVDPFGKMISNIFGRLCKPNNQNVYAKEFRKALEDAAVFQKSIKELDSIVEIKSFYDVRDITGENVASAAQAFQLFRGDPSVAQPPLYERQVRALLGPDAVLELLPPDGDQVEFVKAGRKQMEEISAILNGFDVPVTPDDMHEAEGPIIVQWLEKEFKGALSGDPKTPDVADLEIAIKHAEGHIQALLADKLKHNIGAQLQQQLAPIIAILKHLQQVAQQAAALSPANLTPASPVTGGTTPPLSNATPQPAVSSPVPAPIEGSPALA